jgi:hypothetical protein
MMGITQHHSTPPPPKKKSDEEVEVKFGPRPACLPRYSEFQLSELGNPQLSVGLKFT